VRAPTYQNLQGVPMMIKDQQLADMTITLGSIDPCFSCTDRLETIDLKSGTVKVWSPEELLKLARAQKTSADFGLTPGVMKRDRHLCAIRTPLRVWERLDFGCWRRYVLCQKKNQSRR
jgi:hypothetical protein